MPGGQGTDARAFGLRGPPPQLSGKRGCTWTWLCSHHCWGLRSESCGFSAPAAEWPAQTLLAEVACSPCAGPAERCCLFQVPGLHVRPPRRQALPPPLQTPHCQVRHRQPRALLQQTEKRVSPLLRRADRGNQNIFYLHRL